MDLLELQSHWDQFGQSDPLWAILSVDGKRGGGWDVDEFFATGRSEIEQLIGHLAALDGPRSRRAALDFGCGVGRLTQALSGYFEQVTGVDIAPSMIEEACSYNRNGDRCRFVLNARDDLSLFPDGAFDLIYSNIVFQHMRPKYSRVYIQEFVRLLSPGGIAVFQIPSEFTAGPKAGSTGDVAPLPPSAFRARIIPAQESLTLEAGQILTIRATVENLGDTAWPGGRPGSLRPVQLGNHWLDSTGSSVALDDARAGLPADVPPGGKVELALAIAAPRQPGEYRLELDLVQEHVAWFAHKGSEPARLPVTVRRGARQAEGEGPAGPLVPRIEMHGMHWSSVVRAVVDAGGMLLDIREDDAAPHWISYRYFIARRP